MLAKVSTRLEALHEALDAYLANQGFKVSEAGQEIADQHRPTEWFG